MVLAVSASWLASLSLWSIVGYALLSIGMVATFLSSYRYLLLYLLSGMGYWLVVEMIQSGLVNAFTINVWHSYVAALAITWLLPGMWISYRLSRAPQTTTQGYKNQDTYIEHTPIYENYKPRFHN